MFLHHRSARLYVDVAMNIPLDHCPPINSASNFCDNIHVARAFPIDVIPNPQGSFVVYIRGTCGVFLNG
jgi:hypothetical protein